MSLLNEFRTKLSKNSPFRLLPRTDWSGQRATYRDAAPAVIGSALARSQGRPSGNWYAFAASSDVRRRPLAVAVAGLELVAWRCGDGVLRVGPAACPHLGADLSTGRVDRGDLVCPWHGLRLTGAGGAGWSPLPAHDDGVIAWVRLDAIGGEPPTEAPILGRRPDGARIHAVTQLVGVCEPRDILANRLDPWHGSWFHPYSFTRLEVLSAPPVDDDLPEQLDRLLVAVTFRIGCLGVPVVAEFTSPEPRTISMHILEGEGSGSVVETHATPLGVQADGRCRTAVIEAVIAHSDRPRFAHALRGARLLTPLMRSATTRLWRDDLVYAERLFTLRNHPAIATRTADLRSPEAESVAPPTD
jgi:nitrite reductase/ring-hydroxylating ferredoxin subunit